MAKIKVIRTEVWEYEPDLNEDWYQEAGCKNIQDALNEDKRCYEEFGMTLDEFAGNYPDVSTSWEIID